MDNEKDFIEITEEQFKILEEKFKKEERYQGKKNLLNSIIATTTMIISVAAVYTYYVQDRNQLEISNILEKEIYFKSEDLRRETENARINIIKLLSEVEAQTSSIASFNIVETGSLDQDVPRQITKMSSKISIIESEIRKIQESKILEKINAIEDSIEGNPIKVLSVPLIKNDFKNYKKAAEKEFLRLERNVEKLDSRLSFFVTTTITLTLGIFTAVIAPLFLTFLQRRREKSQNLNT